MLAMRPFGCFVSASVAHRCLPEGEKKNQPIQSPTSFSPSDTEISLILEIFSRDVSVRRKQFALGKEKKQTVHHM